jgi:hypothetical protein
MIIKNITLVLFCCLLLFSCLYKAGNRKPDINFTWDVNISPYYVKKYLKTIDPLYATKIPTTAEMDNYPENFVSVINKALGYKYVIGFYSLDSISYIESHYFDLASLYDFKKEEWIKDRDSLKNNELEKFRLFFKDSILTKVVRLYKNKIPDSLLFIGRPDTIILKPLK